MCTDDPCPKCGRAVLTVESAGGFRVCLDCLSLDVVEDLMNDDPHCLGAFTASDEPETKWERFLRCGHLVGWK